VDDQKDQLQVGDYIYKRPSQIPVDRQSDGNQARHPGRSSQFNGARKRTIRMWSRVRPLEEFTSLVQMMSMSRIEWGSSRQVKPVESVYYEPKMNVSVVRDTTNSTRRMIPAL